MPSEKNDRIADFLQWWPVIVFCAVQLAVGGVIYGDLRARLTSIETLLRSGTYVTRAEFIAEQARQDAACTTVERGIQNLNDALTKHAERDIR